MVKVVHPRSTEKTFQNLLDLSVELNALFFEMAQSGPMQYRDHHPTRQTQDRIARVRTEKHLRKKIRRIAERFPHHWPVHEQAAYIIRAYSGLQIFPDANHRTGLAIMRSYLHHHGHDFALAGEELKEFINTIRNPRSEYCTRCNAGQLLDRDKSFLYIARRIDSNLRKLSWFIRMSGWITGSRLPRPVLFTSYEDPDDERHRKTRSAGP